MLWLKVSNEAGLPDSKAQIFFFHATLPLWPICPSGKPIGILHVLQVVETGDSRAGWLEIKPNLQTLDHETLF